MTDGDAGFAVDLYRLEKVAKDHLPTVSMVYDKALGKCKDGEAGLSGIANVPEQFHGPGGSVFHAYGQLHAAITDVLTSTRTNLDETADALHETVRVYAETDQGISDELDRQMREKGTPKPEVTS